MIQIDNSQLVSEYRWQFSDCELTPHLRTLPGYAGDLARSLRIDAGVELNHIWSLGRRPDLWSNVISLHPVIHRWFHAHPIEGRIACLYAKWLKGGADWNLEELNFAAGKFVVGWLECQEGRCDPHFEGWRMLIVTSHALKGNQNGLV